MLGAAPSRPPPSASTLPLRGPTSALNAMLVLCLMLKMRWPIVQTGRPSNLDEPAANSLGPCPVAMLITRRLQASSPPPPADRPCRCLDKHKRHARRLHAGSGDALLLLPCWPACSCRGCSCFHIHANNTATTAAAGGLAAHPSTHCRRCCRVAPPPPSLPAAACRHRRCRRGVPPTPPSPPARALPAPLQPLPSRQHLQAPSSPMPLPAPPLRAAPRRPPGTRWRARRRPLSCC